MFAVPHPSPEGIAVKIRRTHIIIASVILLGLIFMTLGVYFLKDPVRYYAHSLRLPQEADSVAGYPIAINGEDEEEPKFWTAEFEPNLSQLSPMERFRLPTARHFNRPTTPIASGHGLVLYTGDPVGYPGKAVLLGHRLPNGDLIQTLYAGLATITVRVGEQIARDESLGTLDSELYFEIRQGASIDISREEIAGVTLNTPENPAPNRLDPDEFFQTYFPVAPAGQELEAFALIRKQKLEQRSSLENLRMDAESAIKLHESTAE
ncbi:MAG: peptidoglycan DD-metalloendopeptidase family protein [Akkermansiaceae bacterium]|jgi:murein DD-endopeptidase MepM/ murein hydrolase activator NlpD